MKNILSFFILLAYFCILPPLYAQKSALEDEYILHSGILLKNTYIQARLFTELEKLFEKKPVFNLTSWSVAFEPLDFLAFHIGTNSYSGIWSRFNDPSPNKISPLKQAYNPQKRLIVSNPSKGSSKKPLSAAVNVSFPFAHFQLFSSILESQDTFAGAGIEFPFSAQPFNTTLTGRWSSAWRMINMQGKAYESWFIDSKYYTQEYFHSFITELALDLPKNTILIGIGLSQHPHEKPIAPFFRAEYSLSINPFLLNMHVFMRDLNYLGQNGSFQRDTIQFSINPQLRFTYFQGLIRSIAFGASSMVQLQNGKNMFYAPQSAVSFDIASEIKLLFLAFEATASLSELLFDANKEKKLLSVQENSLLVVKSGIRFVPWYYEKIQRVWSIKGCYEKKLYDKANMRNVDVVAKLSTNCNISEKIALEAHLYAEKKISLNKRPIEIPSNYGIEIEARIKTHTLKNHQTTTLSAQTVFNTSNNSIQSEFSIVFSL